ncbi:hypothetical protein POM88_008715 [Heracleum sosnowskyi]|uniref:Pectinesterase inhibitor domain-containing protein n=1 Tax=Heracleum sosnowskyi TaxID=360622 RepID=A0AAD8N7J2_9APIA|nr:hypothetical protein POM88_008715 [Heracleum sosnowskyi]
MNPTYHSFLFLLSLAFCLVLSYGRLLVLPTSNLTTEACSQSPKKDLCEKIINLDQSNPRKNLNDIAFIAFDQTDKAATTNLEFVSQATAISATAPNDPAQSAVDKAIKICSIEYEHASDAIDGAISALTSGTKGEVIEKFLKDATTSVETCQVNTKGQNGIAMQLDHMNQDLLDHLENALGVFHVYLENN